MLFSKWVVDVMAARVLRGARKAGMDVAPFWRGLQNCAKLRQSRPGIWRSYWRSSGRFEPYRRWSDPEAAQNSVPSINSLNDKFGLVKQIFVIPVGLSIAKSAFGAHPSFVDRPFLQRLGCAEHGGFFMGERNRSRYVERRRKAVAARLGRARLPRGAGA
jgi:hypothetical protein